jgi:signal transduction histidine kinase/DNA-binding NarL/FixJ family response regulator/HPt (histidine-containing phosphotransfer) domain-containing protein
MSQPYPTGGTHGPHHGHHGRQVEIFDKDFQPAFDSLARIAIEACGTPIALITLADGKRQGVKALVGVDGVRQSPEWMSFVDHAVSGFEFFSVSDASLDDRFAKGFLANGVPSVRFFAGAPIISDDRIVLGAVCVIDHVPRRMSKSQRQQLTTLAELAMQIIYTRYNSVRAHPTKLSRERAAELAAVRIAHNELKSQYERLRVATQVAGLGIWELDLRTQRLVWDASLFELYEVDPQDAGNNYSMWRECIHPGDVMHAEEALRVAISRGDKFEATFRAIGRTGRIKWVRAAGVLQFDTEGLPVSMMGTSWDVTAATQAEHALRSANRAAEASNRAKSEFLANMSHEIRTPLTAIIGLTELVLETRLNRQQTDYLTKVQASSRALLGILNDILDFSKIEAGRLEVERTPFQIQSVLDAVSNLFGPEIEKKGLRFSLNVSDKVPGQIAGDPLRLTQVLNNLVSNAIKFTAHGEIQLKLDMLRELDETVLLRFSVVDTGIGMSKEQSANLFQAFSQADGSISRKYGGTGLGLVISQKLVGLMGGELSVISELGEGSTFSFTIQAGAVEAANPAAESAPPVANVRFSGLRVLLVEDNELNQKMVEAFLQKRGAVVTTASHGGEAVDAARHQTFDVILMDLNMPTMDGFEATRKIRALPQGHGLPIIAMTAAVMDKDKQHCLDAGMIDFVAKPIDPGELALALQKWAPKPKSEIAASMQALAKTLKSWLPGKGAESGDTGDAYQSILPVELPGFDIAGALNRVDGNRDLLAYLLFSFAEDQSGLLETINQMLDDHSRAPAANLLHSLKGVAGNLGAIALADAAQKLEREVRVGASLTALPAFVSTVESTLSSIRRFVRPVLNGVEGEGEQMATPDNPALRKLLASLRPYLKTSEVIPSPLIQYLRYLAQNEPTGAPLKILVRQIDNFDHKEALHSIALLIDAE